MSKKTVSTIIRVGKKWSRLIAIRHEKWRDMRQKRDKNDSLGDQNEQ